jgi:hypothetical protein
VAAKHGAALAVARDARDPGFGDAGTTGGGDEAVAEKVVNLTSDVALVAEVVPVEPIADRVARLRAEPRKAWALAQGAHDVCVIGQDAGVETSRVQRDEAPGLGVL